MAIEASVHDRPPISLITDGLAPYGASLYIGSADGARELSAQFLARFANGALGVLETSRVAQGRKMGLTFEVTGTRGAVIVDMERMNEVQLYTVYFGLR